MADRVGDVVQHIVLGDKAVGLAKARRKKVHAVGCQEGQLAVVHEIGALARLDDLILHMNSSSSMWVVLRRLAEGEVVPSVVGDVVRAARGVNLEDVEGAVLVGDLDADVVAVDCAGPIGHTVGVDLAADNAN